MNRRGLVKKSIEVGELAADGDVAATLYLRVTPKLHIVRAVGAEVRCLRKTSSVGWVGFEEQLPAAAARVCHAVTPVVVGHRLADCSAAAAAVTRLVLESA